LIDKGIHPLKISEGFEKACEISLKVIENIAEEIDIYSNNNFNLIESAKTSLGSKVVSNDK